jgi:hypothetical protein
MLCSCLLVLLTTTRNTQNEVTTTKPLVITFWSAYSSQQLRKEQVGVPDGKHRSWLLRQGTSKKEEIVLLIEDCLLVIDM